MNASRTALALAAALSVVAPGCGPEVGGEATSPGASAPGQRAAALVQGAQVYGDALGTGWSDWSWVGHDLANATPIASGTRSISVDFAPWSGLYFHHAGVNTASLTHLELRVHGGTSAGKAFLVWATVGGTERNQLRLEPYCVGGAIPANAWTRCRVPLADLGVKGATVDGVIVQEIAGRTLSRTYFDAITFLEQTPPPAPAGLSALASSGAVDLAWSPVSGATGYHVHRSAAQTGPFTRLTASPQTTTSYRDATAPGGSTLWYAVSAVNAAGEGARSAPVAAAVPGTAVRVTVTPSSAGVRACRALALSATVTGSSDTAVAWSVREGAAGGTVTSTGLYTAPTTAGVYHVVATSRADPAASATASLTVTEQVLGVSVAPGSSTVAAGGTVRLTATVTTTCGAFTTTQTALAPN